MRPIRKVKGALQGVCSEASDANVLKELLIIKNDFSGAKMGQLSVSKSHSTVPSL